MTLVEDDLWWKTAVGWRRPLAWKTTFGGRQLMEEDDFLWKKTFVGRRRMTIHDFVRHYMTMHNFVWQYVNMYDFLFIFLTCHDPAVRCATMYYSRWLCMVLYNPLLHGMTMTNSVRLNWTLYDCVWPWMSLNESFGTSGRCSSWSPFRWLTGTMIVHPYFHYSFLFSVTTFSHRRSAWIKKHIQRKLTGAPKYLEVDTFQDPFGHFGAPWWPFWF